MRGNQSSFNRTPLMVPSIKKIDSNAIQGGAWKPGKRENGSANAEHRERERERESVCVCVCV